MKLILRVPRVASYSPGLSLQRALFESIVERKLRWRRLTEGRGITRPDREVRTVPTAGERLKSTLSNHPNGAPRSL
jgi:hypothetical protein